MRIIKIEIKDFRAFRGAYTIDLHGQGQNLLLYGENGSGKSSLFQALNLFFAPPTDFSSNKNIFVNTQDGYVKLEIGADRRTSRVYEWEETTHPYSEPLIVETAKAKGFLDYRSLLETHYIHRHADQINVFSLLINTLLANTPNPVTQNPFPEDLQRIQDVVGMRKSQRRTDQLDQLIPDFNAGLTRVLADLTQKTNELLTTFDPAVKIELALPGLTVADKNLHNQVINLTASYYDRPIPSHHHFLNEARLSAIAISIYLGALLLIPPSQLRVLFLDDVLIGLDMSNRLPLLDVLAHHSADWQIIITTYDRVWFEIVRERVKGWQPAWACEEFFTGLLDDSEMPVHAKNKGQDYLAIAQQHLDTHDLKAAAIYARSAYEHEIKKFCDKHHLPVKYYANPQKQLSNDFWDVVKGKQKNDGTLVVPSTLTTRIELYRAKILHPLSHTAPVTLVRREVEEAIAAVNDLANILQNSGRP